MTAINHTDATAQKDKPPTLPANVREIATKNAISYQGDFRAYSDVGGKRLILRDPTTQMPLRCPIKAVAEYERLKANFEALKRKVGIHALAYNSPIGPVARAHMLAKTRAEGHAAGTLDSEGEILVHLVFRFDNPALSDLTAARIERYLDERRREPGAIEGTLISPRTLKNELSALSTLYERAIKWGLTGSNPVRHVTNRPTSRQLAPATWLTRTEGARLLDAAARLDAETRLAAERVADYKRQGRRPYHGCALPPKTFAAARRFPHCEALIATYLYTGGRLMEVLGLDIGDLDFANRRIRFKKNHHRELKKAHHNRKVPFWRPLRDILRHYLEDTGRTATTSGLLFTSRKGATMKGFATAYARCLAEAGLITPGRRITRHTLRHTFATLMLCTVVRTEEGGWAERSSNSVKNLLGHRTTKLIETTYGHDTDGVRRSKHLSYERDRQLSARRLRRHADDAAPGLALVRTTDSLRPASAAA
jgi:integrase